MRLPE
jgi:hypothetical protein